MAKSRRERLLEKKRELEKKKGALRGATNALQNATRKLGRIEGEVETLRKEFDELTYPAMQDAVQDLADEVGPTLLPEDDRDVARFFLDNQLKGGPYTEPVFRFLACKIGSILARMIEKDQVVCARAHEILEKVMVDDGETVTADYRANGFRGASEVLALVFAKRMLREEEAERVTVWISRRPTRVLTMG